MFSIFHCLLGCWFGHLFACSYFFLCWFNQFLHFFPSRLCGRKVQNLNDTDVNDFCWSVSTACIGLRFCRIFRSHCRSSHRRRASHACGDKSQNLINFLILVTVQHGLPQGNIVDLASAFVFKSKATFQNNPS